MFLFIGFNSLTFFILLLTFLVSLYLYLTRNYKYWTSRGIDGPKPIVFFGTLYNAFFRPMNELMEYNSKKFGKIYGTFMGSRPILIIADPQLIKDMNIKDFHIFVDHNDFITGDPLNDRSLFNLFGDDWKKMRSIISPTFSSGKMRKMYPLIEDCVQRLETAIIKKATDSSGFNEIELKKFMGNLTMDVIALCAFGTKIDTHNDPNNQFIKKAEVVFRGNWRIWVFFLLKTTIPKILDLTGFQVSDPSVANFFRSAIRAILSKRKEETKKYNDFLQLMINANKKDSEEQENDSINNEAIYGQSDETEIVFNKSKVEITEDDILATSFLFFIAGFETTASLLSFLFYSLALDQKCQQKLYEEVVSFKGKFDYESIAQMSYLDACIAETLRLYNPLSAVSRISSEDYVLGDTGIIIEKGTLINFDIQSVHHNPEYYPNPHVWDPERFMPENRDNLVPYTYMPFGIGPRNCVGMRFALMEAKTAVVHLINKLKFVKSSNTQIPLKFKKFEFLLTAGDINVGVELRK